MRPRAAVSAAALALAPLAAAAQPLGWSTQPDGAATYTADYTSSGRFVCGPSFFLPPGASCAAAGNSITIGSGSAFLTLAFNGVTSQRITATSSGNDVVTLGNLTKTFTGTGPFLFPVNTNPNVLGFTFELSLASLAPSTSTSASRYGYRFDGSTTTLPVNCCPEYSPFLILGTTPPPPQYRGYGPVVFDRIRHLTLRTTDSAPIGVTAVVGIVPEPATVTLMGAGLLVVGAVARRRARG